MCNKIKQVVTQQVESGDRDFSRVSGVLRAEIPAIPALRVQVRAPESQKVRRIHGGVPGESGI
jgi:hypothetical protein